MNEVWNLSIDEYLEICEQAKKNEKKPGDSIEEELRIFMNEKNRTPIAHINKDIDQLTGDLREEGLKILNMKEVERQKNKGEEL